MPACSFVKARTRFEGLRQQEERIFALFSVRLRFALADEAPDTRHVTLSEQVEIAGQAVPENAAEKAQQNAVARLAALARGLPMISPRLFDDV